MRHYNPEKPFGDSFKADNDTQAGFSDQFVEFSTAEPPLTSSELLDGIREAMSAVHFVHPDIVKTFPIYHKIKVFLERYNIAVPITQQSGKFVARRLICRIWNSAKYARDRSQALQAFENIRNGSLMDLASPIGSASVMQDVFRTPRPDNGHELSGKSYRLPRPTTRSLATSIAERFGSEALKFRRQAKEMWDQYLDSYVCAAREMELTNDFKKTNSHQVLRDRALDFYRDFHAEKDNSWGEVLRMVKDEVNSNVRRDAITDRLRSLHINQYESEDSLR